MTKFNLFVKRTFDLVCSSIGLAILSPLLVLIAFIIKVDSKGPILFKQERIGKDGKIFQIFKFRSMVIGAENKGDGLFVKTKSDPRITRIGNFLRKTSLDELPQLINVFRGEMSIVGPRPPAKYFPYNGYESYPEWAKRRFLIKPGITGLSQVRVRNSVPWNERIKVDLEYIERFNILLDLKIILLTFWRVIKPKSIYLSSD